MAVEPGDTALRERLKALRSAWGVLAPSGLFSERPGIAETGRELSERLNELLGDEGAGRDAAAFAALEARVGELEREMRELALELPVGQLRSTLPERVAVDRRGVLDLLDLILGAELEAADGTEARLPVLDYLITLLCTGGDPNARLQDPVTLTPRLHGLCERLGGDDPALADLAAEFFAAAEMHGADVREEVELRTLRRRKMELGATFFAPPVLRAIMTYNAALLQRIDEEVLSSQDWGIAPPSEAPGEDTSVFESEALPKLAAALRRRTSGDPPAHDPVDRIAWCLDLSYLTEPETRALLAERTGGRENLEGTTVLVGLLRRSAVVLDEEFPSIGIAPDRLAGAWTSELADALQQEVNRRIISEGYDGACAVSDLKGRFLDSSSVGTRARVERPLPPAAPDPRPVPASAEARPAPAAASRSGDAPKRPRETAQELANAALDSLEPGKKRRRIPWKRMAHIGAAGALALAAVALVNTVLSDEGRVARAELEQVSPFLVDGKRSGKGVGTAFTGSLVEEWSQLDLQEKILAADMLVTALRERGITEIMIFDSEKRLRIQAMGEHPPRLVP